MILIEYFGTDLNDHYFALIVGKIYINTNLSDTEFVEMRVCTTSTLPKAQEQPSLAKQFGYITL